MNKVTIGYVSPSTPITVNSPKRYLRSVKYLEDKGFALKSGILTGLKDYYRSGNIKERADEINQLILDNQVDIIMSTIGGANSNSVLPYINYDALIENPKIFIGYSDMTALLWAIFKKTGLISYYGPALVASFGEFEPFNEISFQYFKDILIDNKRPYEVKMPSQWTDEYIDWEEQDRSKKGMINNWKTINPGKTEGRIVAGNLNTITGIWGSQFCINIMEGDILIIEDSLKNAAIVERLFAFLKINNVFDKINGLILGKHELFDDLGTGKKVYDILEEVIGNVNYPILAEFDCSHTHPMFTIPIGERISLDASGKKVVLLGK